MMEILTILDPSSVDWTGMARSTDNQGLNSALVSAALSGTNPIGLSLIEMRVRGLRMSHTGISKVNQMVLDESQRRNWKINREKLRRLTELCLIEYTNPPLCRICHGSGKVSHNNVIIDNQCPLCEGTGQGKYANSHRAHFVGVSRNTWYKSYDKKRAHIEQLFSDILPDFEHTAIKHIKDLLR